MIELPPKFEKQVLEFPEYSYGVTRIVVTLDDGSKFNDVFIAWGKEIIKVGPSEQVPFNPSKIVEIRPQENIKFSSPKFQNYPINIGRTPSLSTRRANR